MPQHERLVYLNGELVPESEARISIFDIGRMYGATFYESIRTFRHRLYKLDEHWRRLERSLTYVGLPALLSRERFVEGCQAAVDANADLTDPDDDLWICAEVTPGETFPMPLMSRHDATPNFLVYSSALPHAAYARCYAEGKPAITSPFRNIPPQSYEQRCKNRSRLPHFMSKLHAHRIDPNAFALLLDCGGYISEGTGANVFFALDGALHTPAPHNILNGVSRATVIELAGEVGIPVVERDVTHYEAYNADEAFWTTTSYCVLPVSAIDGRPIGGPHPGPIATRLLDAWSAKVGVDIVAQARDMADKLSREEPA